jgi:thiol-disulfide isomerase/thioredoxin
MQMHRLALGAALCLVTAAPASAPAAGAAIGRPAPAWSFERWIRTPPLSLESLRGKVVLVRWWTDGCHYCAATLPALETLRARYADRGLVVIGAYHPKPPRDVSDKKILAVADRLGFEGPIAVDPDWSTLERYWLAGHPERGWTSVSFLIDRAGVVRWLHPGGEYHPSSDPEHASCDLEYRRLEEVLSAVLAEPPPEHSPP